MYIATPGFLVSAIATELRVATLLTLRTPTHHKLSNSQQESSTKAAAGGAESHFAHMNPRGPATPWGGAHFHTPPAWRIAVAYSGNLGDESPPRHTRWALSNFRLKGHARKEGHEAFLCEKCVPSCSKKCAAGT